MTKLYLYAPLAGLLVFGAIYWHGQREYQAKRDDAQRATEAAREQKAAEHATARLRAAEAAATLLARRTEERRQKERIEAEQHDARLAAEQRRLGAAEAEKRLRFRLDRLQAEIGRLEAAVTRAEEKATFLKQEHGFLLDSVKQAEANRAAAHQVLQSLETNEQSLRPTPQPPTPVSPRKNS